MPVPVEVVGEPMYKVTLSLKQAQKILSILGFVTDTDLDEVYYGLGDSAGIAYGRYSVNDTAGNEVNEIKLKDKRQ